MSISDDSQDAFEPYYSETYSENSSLSLRDSQHSLVLVSNDVENNPTLLLMHEYMMTVSPALLGSVMELYRGLDLDQLLSQEGLFSDMMMMMCSSVKPHKKEQSVTHQDTQSNKGS